MSDVTMSDVTLADFLLARIADDEAAWSRGLDLVTRPDFARLAGHMLADCEAKRRIVDTFISTVEWAESPDCPAPHVYRERAAALTEALEALALAFADHADYREEWRL